MEEGIGMKRGSFLITFRRMGAKDDCLIELPTRWKLLWWMATTGVWCKGVLIAFLEEGEE